MDTMIATIFLPILLAILAVALLLVILAQRRKGAKEKNKAATTSWLANSLRNERVKSNIILNAIEDGVILVDDQRVIQLLNPGAGMITGWAIDDARSLSWTAVFKFVSDKGEPIAPDQDPVMRLFTGQGTIRDNTANLLTKSGKTVAVSLVVSPILDDQKQITGAVAVLRDVSNERREEQQRAEFISTASHEMRTPVAAIEGYLALALNDRVSTVDTRARGYLEKAHTSTQHLGKLFQDLLTSAKAEDGRLTSHPEVLEVGSFLEQLAGDLRFAAEKKGLSLEFIFSTSHTIDASHPTRSDKDKFIRPLYYAHADPDRLREVLTNLFDNAVKYTERGKVSIGLTGNDQVVQLFIRDTGIGIPPEDIPHMFQKFYRVDNSATRAIGGTGLGLFISRKIVELYDGRIWVESELRKGSTFYINLPRLDAGKAAALKGQGGQQILVPINSLA